MGNNDSRPKAPTVDKIRFEMLCQNTFLHLQLQRDRKIHELQKKESLMRDLVKSNKNNANRENIAMEASNCINQLNYIKGTNIVLNNIKMLKENSIDIVNYLNRQQSMNMIQLEPFVYTVVWSTTRLNLNQIKEFSDFISTHMGKNIYQIAETSASVDLNLKKLFATVAASALEIHDYLEGFCKRSELSLDLIKEMWTINNYGNAGGMGGGMGGGFSPFPPQGTPQMSPFPAQPQNDSFNTQGFQPNSGMNFGGNGGAGLPPGFPPSNLSGQTHTMGGNPQGVFPPAQDSPFANYGAQQPSQTNSSPTSNYSNPFACGGKNIADINYRLAELRRVGA